jgi:hypothetical protein
MDLSVCFSEPIKVNEPMGIAFALFPVSSWFEDDWSLTLSLREVFGFGGFTMQNLSSAKKG